MMGVFAAEQQRYTPYTRKSDYGVNYSAKQGTCTTKNPGHKVKAKKTHETPVKTAYDCKN